MATFNKFNQFVADVANKIHNLGSGTITVALSNTAPVATNAVQADITEISYTSFSTRNCTLTSSTQSGGLYKLILVDLVLTYTGGSASPSFEYVVLYNSTQTTPLGPLIGWYDYGSAISLNTNETFTIDFDNTNGVLTIQ